MPTKIFDSEGFLTFDNIDGSEKLATIEQYQSADRCVGSIFESLKPGEEVELAERIFVLDEDLDLVEIK